MKINVQTKELQAALMKLAKVTPKRSSFALLEGVLVTATGNGVTLAATDLSVRVTVQLKDAETIDAGSIVIQAETLKLIQKLKSNALTIIDAVIYSDNRELKFTHLDASQYPVSTYNYDKIAFTAPINEFIDVIDIRYACSDNESQQVLTGVCFRQKQAISCDRHRLGIKTFPYNGWTKDIIIPAYALNYIPSFVEKTYKGGIGATIDDDKNYIKMTFDNITFEIRLIDGTYPDVSKIVPADFTSSVRVKKTELIDELTLVREVYTGKSTKIVRINSKDGKITVSANEEETGNAIESTLPASFLKGDAIELMALNVDYLLDGLKHNGNDYITLHITGKMSPAMIDNDYLVLPYRVA